MGVYLDLLLIAVLAINIIQERIGMGLLDMFLLKLSYTVLAYHQL
jgi:hypothetical protein